MRDHLIGALVDIDRIDVDLLDDNHVDRSLGAERPVLLAGLSFCRRLRSHTRMANKPKDYSDLPTWPRLMTADLACRYVSYSRNGFVSRVGEIWPQPIRLGGKVLWDKNALDVAVDRLSLHTEPLVDPIMEDIKEYFRKPVGLKSKRRK